jgi:hypothetical protein
MGTCQGAGGNLLTDAFGIVAMVAMIPLIIIQLMGLIYTKRVKATVQPVIKAETAIDESKAGEIIEFGEEGSDE